MELKNVIYEDKEGIGILIINRPNVLNSLNKETLLDISTVIQDIDKKDNINVLIITGAGEKAFVAGADIKEMVNFTPKEGLEFSTLGHTILNRIENLDIPVIAAVNGFALGGGCELALACDFIYASEKAIFGQPEVKLGIIPGFGGTQRLARRIGSAKAKELIFSGESINAQEALKLGLVNRVFPPDKLIEETFQIAKKIASNGMYAVKKAKYLINKGSDMGLLSSLILESNLFAVLFDTFDQKEGMNAFVEKRKPEFKGK